MLKVQVKAQTTAGKALKLLAETPRSYGDLADQCRRAAVSVALNVAEGFERRGKDQRHLLTIARGSAREASVALALLVAAGAVEAAAAAEVERGLDEVRAMLWVMCERRA